MKRQTSSLGKHSIW